MILNEDSPKIPQIKDIAIPLKEHQLALIYQTLECEKRIEANQEEKKNRFLVLSDLPGAGKTNVVLGHIMKIKEKLLKENPYLDKDEEERDPTFIIVPQNILTQWIESINKYFKKKLKFKKFVNYEDMMSLYKNTKMLFQYDIILTTPLHYHMIITTLQDKMIKIHRIIFDEIDTISTMIQTKVEADFIWFVSASFKKDRIGSYYETVHEKDVDDVTFSCTDDFIRQQFPLEEPIIYKYITDSKYVDDILFHVTQEEEMRGINALDFTKIKNEYFKHIPYHDDGAVELVVEENRNEIEFLKLRMSDMKSELKRYEEEVRNDGLEIEETGDGENDTRIQMIFEYRKRLETDKVSLKELENKRDKIRNLVNRNRICMVCYQDIDSKQLKIKNEETGEMEEKPMKEIFRSECCKTDYCIDCIHYLFDVEKRQVDMKKREEELKKKQENPEMEIMKEEEKKKEPETEEEWKELFSSYQICCKKCDTKTNYENYKRTRFMKKRNKEEKKKDRTSKIQRFEHILQQNIHSPKKYIIFSDFYNTFRFIKDTLDKLQIQYIELDGGSQDTIDKAVKEYREGESQVMLSNSTFFGCGLNMEFTTDIIFMHKMEKSTEKQVIGRAQRPGRTSPLNIHYIYYSNEEYGNELQHESHTEFYIDEPSIPTIHDIQEIVFS